MQTPFADELELQIESQNRDDVSNEDDPWNHWVYSLDAGSFAMGERTYSTLSIWGGISASRTTDKFKFESSFDGNYKKNIYTSYDSNGEVILSDTAINKGVGLYTLATKSIGKHWGIGGFFSLRQSTFKNLLFQFSITPAIEYNVFDYAQASKRQLRLLYTIGPKYNQYYDSTDFEKMSELAAQQTIVAIFKYITKWGDLNTSVHFSNYFHDITLTNIGFDVGTKIRIVKGLSLQLYGSVSFPHDRIETSKKSGNSSDVYTHRVQMQTDYSYYFNIGLSYKFGSIYNNVVNPRFDRNFY